MSRCVRLRAEQATPGMDQGHGSTGRLRAALSATYAGWLRILAIIEGPDLPPAQRPRCRDHWQ